VTAWAWALLLVAARVVPAVAIAIMGARVGVGRTLAIAVSALVTAAVATVGAAVIAPAADALAQGSFGVQLTILAREAALGCALGVTAAVPLVAGELVGRWLAARIGDDDGASPWAGVDGDAGGAGVLRAGWSPRGDRGGDGFVPCARAGGARRRRGGDRPRRRGAHRRGAGAGAAGARRGDDRRADARRGRSRRRAAQQRGAGGGVGAGGGAARPGGDGLRDRPRRRGAHPRAADHAGARSGA
jgi:hypothetical protein